MTGLDPTVLRRAFGSFMTGVTVVTTRDTAGVPLGFTANSFTSVSLDPPLLLVCPGKFLSSYGSFATSTHFAVNILAEGQEDVSNVFASSKGDRFAQVPHRLNTHGVPLIDGALAQFSCATHQVLEAGDHCILMGRVEALHSREGQGLGYAGGRYFSLGLERDSAAPSSRVRLCGALVESQGHVLLEQTVQGYRPPQTHVPDRSRSRATLTDALTGRGVTAELGAAYSVFEDTTHHWTYVLGTSKALPTTDTLKPIPISSLPDLTYSSPSITKMMTRYAEETQAGVFSFYLGDALQGETHSLPAQRT